MNIRYPADEFEPAFQRAKVDVSRATGEMHAARDELKRLMVENVPSRLVREALLVKVDDYAIAYRGVIEAENAEADREYVRKDMAQISKTFAAFKAS